VLRWRVCWSCCCVLDHYRRHQLGSDQIEPSNPPSQTQPFPKSLHDISSDQLLLPPQDHLRSQLHLGRLRTFSNLACRGVTFPGVTPCAADARPCRNAS
jgi:hypothetical protein